MNLLLQASQWYLFSTPHCKSCLKAQGSAATWACTTSERLQPTAKGASLFVRESW